MAMLHPLQLVCKSRLTIVSRYLTKFLVLLEELVDIIPPCRPCVWLLKREAPSWLEHNRIDLSGENSCKYCMLVFDILQGNLPGVGWRQIPCLLPFSFSGTLHDSGVKHFGHQGWVGLLVT